MPFPRSPLAALAAGGLLLVAGAVPASASTIAYQCGSSVCTIDPDGGSAKPKTVATGRLAGITRDGKTLSWVPESGGLVQAGADGKGARTVFDKAVVNQPSMSPDGKQYLWWYPGPDGFGGLTAVWTRKLTVGKAESNGVSFCGGCVVSHGWLNQTPIAAYPRGTSKDEPQSMVCRVATPEEEPGATRSCVQVLVRDPRGGIAFPSGNPAGSEIVAALTPDAATGVEGRIVRYSLATGAPIGDLTQGTADTTPVFSPEGDRVAFERDGKIVVKDLAGGSERTIATGVYPFWGGARGPATAIASTSLRYRKGRIAIKLRCGGGTTCRGSVRIKKGRTAIGSRSFTIKAGRSATVAVTPSRRGRAAIRRRQTVTVTVAPRTGKTATAKLTLRR
ncbi:hypothetical protein [Patulibacter defluvii]|uniref:hypothetical protein n=1 Tax=Patulibacter defluvii TaxID=3095358 RepID=UPI002A74E874|nr:hypothetical protein [Patulibacter sp. DM4]